MSSCCAPNDPTNPPEGGLTPHRAWRILHLEDNPFDVALTRDLLTSSGIACESVQVDSREEFSRALCEESFDLILADHTLPSFDSGSALEIAHERCPGVPFIILTGTLDPAGGPRASGITDFIRKEDLARLPDTVRRVLQPPSPVGPPDAQTVAEAQREFFNGSADLLCLLGGDGRLWSVNSAWEGALGYSAAELTGQPLNALIHAEDRQRFESARERAFAGQGAFRVEARCHTRLGAWRWLQWQGTLDTARCLLHAVVRDVTQSRLAQDNVRQREQYFRSLIDNVSDIITVLNEDGTFRYQSPSLERVLGYRPEELIGRDAFEHIHPEEREHWRALFLEVIATPGRSVDLQFRFAHKDGSWRVLEGTGRHMVDLAGHSAMVVNTRDATERRSNEAEIQKLAAFPRLNPHAVLEFSADGNLHYFNDAAHHMAGALGENHPSRILPVNVASIVQGCLATGQNKLGVETAHSDRVVSWAFYPIPGSGVVHCYAEDVTERKRAADRIAEQAALLDKAHDSISVHNLDHEIIYWNQGSERLYGWSAAEVIGRSAFELLFKKPPEELARAREAVLAQGEWSGEFRQTNRSGKEVVVQNRWTLVREAGGRPKSILVISTDITEEKRLQSQFFRAQRLESIGKLASGIAHDLNNVLAPIMMSVNLLQETAPDDRNAKLLETLRLSAQRGADMVKQILAFTRGEEGSRCPVNLKHLVLDLAKIARETFPRNIQIRLNTARDLWPITADATQVHQVLMNLSVNARDAMPEGGVLHVQAENILLEEPYTGLHLDAKPGPYVMLTVADNGIGIAPEHLEKIFDPFFTLKAPGQGTGLGLSTSLSIVKNHAGFINVYSEPGKGTRFKVYLPATQAAVVAVPPESRVEPPKGHGESILVVDDERAFQEITKAIFNKYGYRVLTASDGTEALALFAENRGGIDLVLTDIMMPFMDGPATIRALQRLDPNVRIIAASGLMENESLTQKCNNATFLLKPFTTEKLLTLVDQTLRERTQEKSF